MYKIEHHYLLWFCMETALLVAIALCIAAGVTGALIRSWSILSRLYSLEDRVGIIEGTVTREVKVRAAAERWKKPSKDEAAIVAALEAPPEPKIQKAWWENLGAPRSFSGN